MHILNIFCNILKDKKKIFRNENKYIAMYNQIEKFKTVQPHDQINYSLNFKANIYDNIRINDIKNLDIQSN